MDAGRKPDTGVSMTIGSRILRRLAELGMTQGDLSRSVGLAHGTIGNLIRGRARSSTHLHRIAVALKTTTAYLESETDDPSEAAPPPAPKSVARHLYLPVALPAEAVLAEAFRSALADLSDCDEEDRARALAGRFPTILQLTSDVLWRASFPVGGAGVEPTAE